MKTRFRRSHIEKTRSNGYKLLLERLPLDARKNANGACCYSKTQAYSGLSRHLDVLFPKPGENSTFRGEIENRIVSCFARCSTHQAEQPLSPSIRISRSSRGATTWKAYKCEKLFQSAFRHQVKLQRLNIRSRKRVHSPVRS